jgi:4'-phosphopantetheinyl transferase
VPCRVWWAPAGWAVQRDALLTPAELGERRRLRRDADRDRFTTGRVLTRLVLAEVLGVDPRSVPVRRTCPDCGEPHGKPRVPGSGWELSLAHSGDLVGLAVAPGVPVGLDVERVVPVPAGDLDAVLTDAERRDLARVPHARSAEAALRLWVRKESLVKATGRGLRADLTRFTVGPALAAPRACGDVDGTPATDAVLVDLRAQEGYVASLAVLAGAVVVSEQHVDLPAAG